MKTPSFIIVVAALALSGACAQVPSIINYQGRVTVGGTNLTTNAALFKFALVNSNGTAVYWNNDGTTMAGEPSNSVSVAVAQGLYSTLLGDTTLSNMAALPMDVFTNANVNLRVWFSRGGTNPFVQLAPDQRIGASGYALRAAAADSATIGNVTGNLSVSGSLSAGQVVAGSSSAATGLYSVVLGGLSNTASNDAAVVVGGTNNKSLGLASFIGAGADNEASGSFSIVSGGLGNRAADGALGGTIGGGQGNTIANFYATVAGGFFNTATGDTSVVGGGQQNVAGGAFSAVSGGAFNVAENSFTVVGGGEGNTAGGDYATVPGGLSNTATLNAFAAGKLAKATNTGAFVWSDASTNTDFGSTADNQFLIRAAGGVGINTNNPGNYDLFVEGDVRVTGQITGLLAAVSDSNSKTNFQPIKAREILSKIAALPLTSWHYKHDLHRRYIGPMAQDFHAAFDLGSDDKTISTLDSDGVMYAAIQGLVEELQERDKTIDKLKSKLEAVERRLDTLPPAP